MISGGASRSVVFTSAIYVPRWQKSRIAGMNGSRSLTSAASSDTDGITVVGAGRVGEALIALGSNPKDKLIRRGEPIPEDCPGAIIVCTRNNDLQGVVDATPASRKEDLVFIQNGMLQPWLDERGLGDNTQALIYFAVAKKGEDPIDGKTDLNPEGLTAAYGKHSSALAERLARGDLSCKVLEKEEFKQSMLEKLVWICAFMLVGANYPGAKVGDVESQYRDEVCRLIRELYSAGATKLGVPSAYDANILSEVEDRLCAYARSVAHFPTAVKEFEWRNGYFYDITKEAIQSGKGDPCSFHSELLEKLGAVPAMSSKS